MNKKDLIRTYLLTKKDGFKFTAGSLATDTNSEHTRKDITHKDVGNVIQILVKNGAITSTKSKRGILIYSIVGNNVALWFAKHPIGKRKPKQNATQPAAPATRRKNRTPFVISIDKEIAELNLKIKRLNSIRGDYT